MRSFLIKPAIPITLLLLSYLILAGCSSTADVARELIITPSETIEPTLTSTSTQTRPPPTVTPLPPTPTLTPTNTVTTTPTSTSEPASLVVEQDAVCLTGPGTVYDVRAYLTEGDKPALVGHVQDNTWWKVEEPNFDASCWVSEDSVSVQGNLDNLVVLTPEPTPTIEPSPTPKQKGMKIFLIAENTGGPFGCGDGLVYYFSGKPRTDSIERDISSALNALFKLKTKYIGDHYNPVYNAHLHVKEVDVVEETGKVFVYLAGSIPKPANVCEAERIHDQVWETARQISGYRNVTIRVGNKLLGDLIAVGDR